MSDALAPETWTGPFREPRNMAAEVKGSIHDDATATRLGFRGGTVAGSVHMDQFVPHLVGLYGDGWFETGGLSLYFVQATVDREEVQARADGGQPHARLAMINRAGALICTGTGSGGPDPGAELVGRMAGQADADRSRLRILAPIRVGDVGEARVVLDPERLKKHREIITEDLPCYADGVLPPSQAVGLAHQARSAAVGKAAQPHVGLFGALEVQHLAGPLKAGVEYVARTRILKLTESPKTENTWHDVVFSDDGRDIARVLFYLRFLKGSSPLWA
ncbi:MAG: hypothetical protein JNL41_13640 [Phenylobacterium sp.]|uniref:hypothetical protein n=1 Tax=Phenylobacterium sp. TaxID=1871053 RepID=UPI001A4BCAA2|nr:hypothetical protein [Phenylobacterium sp.]MBL8555314.1 hypothetical protein [Phenylobacterium sp.]